MIKSTELQAKLEAMMEIITCNYSPAKYDPEIAIDVARYRTAKRVYEEADDALCSCDIDWDSYSEEDYNAIAELMEKLYCEIEMMEEDLGIEA